MSDFEALPKESFIPAEWLSPDAGLEDIGPRWQGCTADLPNRGNTTLYPLRSNNFGQILPHKYAKRMQRDTNGPLTQLNLLVNGLYGHNGGYDDDRSTQNFQSILRELKRKPYNERPELATILGVAFEGYKDAREEQRQRVAHGLTKTIRRCELYIVAVDSADWRTENEGNIYAAPLAGVVNVRNGDGMNYQVVVGDFNGNKGFMPETFSAPGGVCAPAAQ